MTFSHDGSLLAIGHGDNKVERGKTNPGKNSSGITLWNTETFQPVRELTGHRFGSDSVAFAPNGNLVSGSEDRTIRVWDVTAGKELGRYGDELRFIRSVAVSPSGRYLLAGGSHPLDSLRGLFSIIFPSAWSGLLQLWDIESGERVRSYSGNRDTVTKALFTANGLSVIGLSFFEKTVRSWDAESGELLAQIPLHEVKWEGTNDFAVFSDSRRILVGGPKRTGVVDLENRRVVQEWPAPANDVGILRHDSVAVSMLPQRIVLRNIPSQTTLADLNFAGFKDRFTSIAVAPDGEHFVVGTLAGNLVSFRFSSKLGAEESLQ